jgi:hypothetical protein
MKKTMLAAFIAVLLISCNDYGGERKDYLIDNQKQVKPLEKQYAGIGILAWAGVTAVGVSFLRKKK